MELLHLLPKFFVSGGKKVTTLGGSDSKSQLSSFRALSSGYPVPDRGHSSLQTGTLLPGTNIATHRLLFQISM